MSDYNNIIVHFYGTQIRIGSTIGIGIGSVYTPLDTSHYSILFLNVHPNLVENQLVQKQSLFTTDDRMSVKIFYT